MYADFNGLIVSFLMCSIISVLTYTCIRISVCPIIIIICTRDGRYTQTHIMKCLRVFSSCVTAGGNSLGFMNLVSGSRNLRGLNKALPCRHLKYCIPFQLPSVHPSIG